MYTVGEMYLSPIGLSLVMKIAPPRIVSMLMGVWFMSVFLEIIWAGTWARITSKMSHPAFFVMLLVLATWQRGSPFSRSSGRSRTLSDTTPKEFMSEQNVGFIGVGRMGGRMARRLIDAGYRLTIFDTDQAAVRTLTDAGAHAADSPAAVASAAEIVLASLPTPPVVEAVALGPGGVAHGSRVRFLWTCPPPARRTPSASPLALAAKNITAMDAP